MNLEELSAQVLDVIEAFDAATAPFGLYAARDILLKPRPKEFLGDFLTLKERQPELRDLEPFITQVGNVTDWAKQDKAKFRFSASGLGLVDLTLVRTSKIKVRKFGSGYCIDKQENFASGWEQLDLGDGIARLWGRSGYWGRLSPYRPDSPSEVKMLLFLGFDRAARPFERELMELKSHQNREARGVTFVSREWEDHYERKFFVRAALWARQANGEPIERGARGTNR